MGDLFYQPEGAWVGDQIPFFEDGVFYAFYLHDPRVDVPNYAADTTWHLVTTRDFVHLENKGVAIERGGEKEQNRNAYTGSVIRGKDGVCRAFYTGHNPEIGVDGQAVQVVMQAEGPDPEHLTTRKDFRFPADDARYEIFDWRDPFVFWNEEEGCYNMLLCARKKGSGALRGGCIALARSADLLNWEYGEPFYDPGMYVTMECPEVFFMGGYWYLVFSTFSDRFTTHYRMARSLRGPWIIPEDDAFDTRADYAVKTASDGERRYAFGWIASKRGETDFGPWEWGGTMVFHEIRQREDGTLYVTPTDGTRAFYRTQQPLTGPVAYERGAVREAAGMFPARIASEAMGALLFDVPKDRFSLSAVFRVKKAHEFGLALHADAGLETGYFLRMNPACRTVAWDLWPRTVKGSQQWSIDGDVPCQIETARPLPERDTHSLLVIREKEICVVYLDNEIALSTRMYDHKGGKGGVYLIQGEAELLSFEIRT